MGVAVTEVFPYSVMPWSDPNAFLACDAPGCSAPWVAASGLMSWRIASAYPRDSFWSNLFVIGCNPGCLAAAQRRHGASAHWSEPMPVGDWLDALRDSLALDPQTTPIGEMRLPDD